MATTKIFVGSLPPGTKPEELRHLFEDYGVVVECDVMNRCGFVHMESKEMANTAIAALNASEFKSQMIVVELGRPKDKKPSGDKALPLRGIMGSRGGGRGGATRGGGNRNGGPGNRGGGMGDRDGGMMGASNGRPNFGNAGGGGGQRNKFNHTAGPIRNDNFKQQRNMPYQRRNPQEGAGGGGMFGGNQRGNFNSAGVGRSRGFGHGSNDVNQPSFHNQVGQIVEGNGHYSGGINHFNDNDGGYRSNIGGNFGGNAGGASSGRFGGAPHKIMGAQDRRGFALSTGGRGGGQRFGGDGNTGGAFRGANPAGAYGGMQNNVSDDLFSRRSNNRNSPGSNLPPHGGFQGGFGGGRGRGGFRRGGVNVSPGGMGGSHNYESFPAQSNYNSNFPPLGAQEVGGGRGGRGGRGGGMQRNGPRQNMMPNPRF